MPKTPFLSRTERIMSMLPPEDSEIDSPSEADSEENLFAAKNDNADLQSSPVRSLGELEGMIDLDYFINNSTDDVFNMPDVNQNTSTAVNTNQPDYSNLVSEPAKDFCSDHPQNNSMPVIDNLANSASYAHSSSSILNNQLISQSNNSITAKPKHTKSQGVKKSHRLKRRQEQKENGEPRLQNRKKLKKNFEFDWKNASLLAEATIDSNNFTVPDAILSPLQYFNQLFDNELLELIVKNSNLYSVQKNCDKPFIIEKADLTDFIAVLLIMGVVQLPAYTDYWSVELRCDKVTNIMSLKKFEQFRRNIHFTDNSLQEQSDDLYFKVRPLLNKIRENCLKTEEENRFSVDEMMIPYKGGRAGNRRQYLKNKPTKWGYKLYVRSGVSGIVYDFLLYGGKNTFPATGYTFSDDEETLGFGGKVVIALSKSIKNPSCKVIYFDNFFASPHLIHYLREEMGLFSLGTLRNNRTGNCNLKELPKKRGSFNQMSDNSKNVTIVQWMDKKPVLVASSYVGVQPVSTIKRYDKESRQKIDIPCPQIVHHYNTHMGGVDLSDMLISLYKTKYKSRKWYLPIFIQMVDLCVNNSWLVYKRHMRLRGNEKDSIPLKKFRIVIADSLTKYQKKPGRPSLNSSKPKLIERPVKSRPPKDVREDNFAHMPEFTSQGRCRFCKDGKTTVLCKKCDVRLCLVPKRNCFGLFHTSKPL